MLPEITERVKAMFGGFGSRPIELGLKGAVAINDVGFDPRSVATYARNGFPQLYSLLGGGMQAWSGETVSIDTALNHSVVFTCKRIIAESTGFLPLSMMQKKGNEKVEALRHPMFTALHDGSEDITAQRLRETITGHCVLGGNGYAQILRRSGTDVAYELVPILPQQVTLDRERTGARRLVYVVSDGAQSKPYTVIPGKPQDILHIPGIGWDGLRGYSILRMARQSIGTAIATERNVGNFFARGGRLPYYLKLKQPFETNEDFEKFRADWEAIYAEPHRAPMLEPFIEEYKQIGLNAVDAQLLETRQFSVPEICRWFRISPHLAGDLTNANYSTIEQLALEFVNFTLHVWLKRWEQELWRCVLTPEEKTQGYFWRHNVNALLRGDFKTRMEGYSIALQNGFINQNEVRDFEDWNGFEGGDDYHIQLNMQQLPTAPAQEQRGQLIRLGNGKKYRRVV